MYWGDYQGTHYSGARARSRRANVGQLQAGMGRSDAGRYA